MGTVVELVVNAEYGALEEAAAHHGWPLRRLSPVIFTLAIEARDGSLFWLYVDCDGYSALPPAWHWYDPASKALDLPQSTPTGGGYFHGNGVICAPWNRLAYKSIDSRGPHDNWTIGDWRRNPKTGGCKTLAAMALRIGFELAKESFDGKRKAA